jgi:hypothetical protein
VGQFHFFAVRDDLLLLLVAVERRGPLSYTRMGNFDRAECDRFDRGFDIPGLGRAATDSASACDSFLVTVPDVPVRLRSLETATGERRYCVDQLINPDTLEFSPGGLLGEEAVLSGRVATVSDTAMAKDLMGRFRSGVKKSFRRVKAYWVGPGAFDLLRAGYRLTASVGSPREFDLALNPPGNAGLGTPGL